MLCDLRDLSSPTTAQTHNPCSGSAGLNHWIAYVPFNTHALLALISYITIYLCTNTKSNVDNILSGVCTQNVVGDHHLDQGWPNWPAMYFLQMKFYYSTQHAHSLT